MQILRILCAFSISTICSAYTLNHAKDNVKGLDTQPRCSDFVYNRIRADHEATVEEFKNKTKALFRCPAGKTLIGNSVSGCAEDGTLRRVVPACVPFGCSFASDNLCGWSSDTSWTRQNGLIRPNGSESTRCTNFTLTSPTFPVDKKNIQPLCFWFSYMVNTTTRDQGYISVWVDDDTDAPPYMVLEAKHCQVNTGGAGDIAWRYVNLPVKSINDYKIIIVGQGDVSFNSLLINVCPDDTDYDFPQNLTSNSSCPSTCESENTTTTTASSTTISTTEMTITNSTNKTTSSQTGPTTTMATGGNTTTDTSVTPNSTSPMTTDDQIGLGTTTETRNENPPMTTSSNNRSTKTPAKTFTKSFEVNKIPVSVWIGICTGAVFLLIGGIAVCLYYNGRKQRRVKKMTDALRRQMRSDSTPGSTLSMSSASRSSTLESRRGSTSRSSTLESKRGSTSRSSAHDNKRGSTSSTNHQQRYSTNHESKRGSTPMPSQHHESKRRSSTHAVKYESKNQKKTQNNAPKKKATGPPKTLNFDYDSRIWDRL